MLPSNRYAETAAANGDISICVTDLVLSVLRILRRYLSELASSVEPAEPCDEGWPSHVVNSVREDCGICGNVTNVPTY